MSSIAPPTSQGVSTGTFRSLRYRNTRLFFAGLLVSNIGTWIQFTAVVLLVQRLGGRGVELGIVTACQFLPMLLLGLWAGSLADRFDRRKMTFLAETGLGVQAVTLGVLDLAGLVTLPLIYVLTSVLGVFAALDNPARRGLATELVPRSDLTNVMSLNTSVMTGSRIFGPAVAALLVSVVGTGWCFVVNGVSFLALLGALVAIDVGALHRAEPAPRSATPVRDGLRAVWSDPVLRPTIVVYAVVSTFGFNHVVSFPLLLDERLGRSDDVLGWWLSVTSIGSFLGALMIARLASVRQRWFLGTAAVLSVTMTVLAVSTSVVLSFVVAVPFGATAAAFVASSNSIFAERTAPEMRGRVLALGAVLFLGSTPIGGPITGVVGDAFGAAWSMFYGAAITALVVAAAAAYLWRGAAGTVNAAGWRSRWRGAVPPP